MREYGLDRHMGTWKFAVPTQNFRVPTWNLVIGQAWGRTGKFSFLLNFFWIKEKAFFRRFLCRNFKIIGIYTNELPVHTRGTHDACMGIAPFTGGRGRVFFSFKTNDKLVVLKMYLLHAANIGAKQSCIHYASLCLYAHSPVHLFFCPFVRLFFYQFVPIKL